MVNCEECEDSLTAPPVTCRGCSDKFSWHEVVATPRGPMCLDCDSRYTDQREVRRDAYQDYIDTVHDGVEPEDG